MRIHVREVTRGPTGEARVVFDSPAGVASGVWRSAYESKVDGRYDVEFTLDRILSIGENATKSDEQSSFVRLEGETVVLNGLVEAIDDDRIGYLRLAPDCLMMLDLADPRIELGDWLRVTAGVGEFDVYAFGA